MGYLVIVQVTKGSSMPTRAARVATASRPNNSPPPTSGQLQQHARELFEGLPAFANRELEPRKTFLDFERALVPRVFELARAVIALFLCRRHEALEVPVSQAIKGKTFARSQVQDREITTFVGPVRYWRTYMRGKGG